MILQERVKLLLFVLLSISLNSFSTNTKFYNISDTYGITSGEAFSICKDQYGFIWTSTKTGILRVTEGDCRNYELPKTTDFVFVKLTYSNSQLFSYTNNGQIFHYDEPTDQFFFLTDLREETDNSHITIGTMLPIQAMYFGLLPRSDSLNMRITYLQKSHKRKRTKASHFL
mgnify:CR=1 FL=1